MTTNYRYQKSFGHSYSIQRYYNAEWQHMYFAESLAEARHEVKLLKATL